VRQPERFRRTVPPLIVAALLSIPAYAADTPEERLKSVEKQLDETRAREAQFAHEADDLAAELAGLRGDSVSAAKSAQVHEAMLTALDERLALLGAEEGSKTEELNRHRTQQMRLLMALERLARNPPEGLALSPGDPIDSLRSAMLLGAAIPPLEIEARALRQEIAALAQVRRQIADARTRQKSEHFDLETEQERLAALIERKTVLQRRAQHGAEESGQRQTQLAAQAGDLQQLIERLSAERRERDAAEAQKRAELETQRRAAAQAAHLPAPPALEKPSNDNAVVAALPPPAPAPRLDPSKPAVLRPFAGARGHMVYPASGELMRRFGENDELGVVSKGITFETRAAAQVIAPYDGRVLFAGPFQGYGQILIIEHGDGYHSLLAGLDRVESPVGQWLVAGEPVGVMPKGETQPHLYLELRHNGQPINPLPWLATRDEKVSG
jgi:septal ring factor EnvC (AmiA/AmiB activator)